MDSKKEYGHLEEEGCPEVVLDPNRIVPIVKTPQVESTKSPRRRCCRLAIAAAILMMMPLVGFGILCAFNKYQAEAARKSLQQQKMDFEMCSRAQHNLSNAIYDNDTAMVNQLLTKVSYLNPNWRVPDDNARFFCRGWPRLIDSTALHLATACNKSADVVKTIMDHGAYADMEGRFLPLQYAAGNGNYDVVKLLLQRGAHVDAAVKYDPNLMGYTPLMFAAKNGHFNVCRLLIEKGADVLARSENGKSAIELAVHSGVRKLVQLFLESYVAHLNSSKLPTNYAELVDSRKAGKWFDKAIGHAKEWLSKKEPIRHVLSKSGAKLHAITYQEVEKFGETL